MRSGLCSWLKFTLRVAFVVWFFSLAYVLHSTSLQSGQEGGVHYLNTRVPEGVATSSGGLCRWPPASNETARLWNLYDLALCPRLDPSIASRERIPKTYAVTDLFRVFPSGMHVFYDDLVKIPRHIWKKAKYPRIYFTYPQDVPMKEIAEAVKAGLSVPEMPEYDVPLHVRLATRSVCTNASKHDLVIVVKSCVFNWDMRDAFRKHVRNEQARHPTFNLGVVFSMGLPRKHGGRRFNRDGHIVSLSGVNGDLLEKYDGRGPTVMEQINREILENDDILLGDYEDTYYNITRKTITNLRWLSAFCGQRNGDVFLVIDDDFRMNISEVIRFIQTTPKDRLRNSIFGDIHQNDPITRDTSKKWFITFRELPWNYVGVYPRGFAQFFGVNVVDNLAIAFAYTKIDYVPDDVLLGMVAFRLGVDLVHLKTMFGPGFYVAYQRKRVRALVASQEEFYL